MASGKGQWTRIYSGVLEEDGKYEVTHFGAVLEQDSLQCSAFMHRERQLCFVLAE